MTKIRTALRKVSPFQTITFSFFLVILAGSILLALPISKEGGGSCPWLDALFTSGSAVCVTGLVTYNTATYWSAFGKAVILLLIQIGGLGVITVVITFSIFSRKQIGLRQRNIMQNSVNAPEIAGIIRFTKFLLFFTLITEFAGAVLLSPVFIKEFGFADGIRKAFFHSISAFCNAGFDILGDQVSFCSLTAFKGNILLNVVIMALIVTGGLGFLTWEDLIKNRFRWHRLKMQSRVILLTSLILIIVPAVLFFAFEFHDEGIKNRILLSLFQSVTTRTAGFNTADLSGMSESARLLMVVLMLIGGSPGSTAGGLKTTTFAVILLTAISFMRQKKNVDAFGRSIALHVIIQAFTLLILYLVLFLTGSVMISVNEGLPILDCMFECASALGTVGLTTGITPSLGAFSKLILIAFMYFGRVGGLTLAFSVSIGNRNNAGKLPEGKIMVG